MPTFHEILGAHHQLALGYWYIAPHVLFIPIEFFDSPLLADHGLPLLLLSAYFEDLHWYETPDIMSCCCVLCDRTFDSDEALQLHKRGAPVHAFDCAKCDRHFGSEEALDQHLRDSPAHAPSFDYESCDRSFGRDEALEQHLRNSRIHQQDPNTPLDLFFRSFPTFNYDPSLSPATSYGNLQEHERWRCGEAVSQDAWNRYQDVLENELRM